MEPLRIVSNSSPLINLSKIERLDLLRKLYGEIIIPEAVYNEVVTDGGGRPGSDAIKLCCERKEIRVWEVTDKNIYRALKKDLDKGKLRPLRWL